MKKVLLSLADSAAPLTASNTDGSAVSVPPHEAMNATTANDNNTFFIIFNFYRSVNQRCKNSKLSLLSNN